MTVSLLLVKFKICNLDVNEPNSGGKVEDTNGAEVLKGFVLCVGDELDIQ